MPRETAMRLAFYDAAVRAMGETPIRQLRLVRRVVRVHERGAGLRGKR